jgi:hypothetical protein
MLWRAGESGGNLDAGLHSISASSAGAASRGVSMAKPTTDNEKRDAPRATLKNFWAKSMAPDFSDK